MHCKITAKLSGDLTITKGVQPYQLGDINTRQVSWYVAFLIPLITVHYFVIFLSHTSNHLPCTCRQFI
jgi:hypothetical protein